MSKPCSDCPFVIKNELKGAPDWLADVFYGHTLNASFRHTCHKTDPDADGYVRGEAKSCVGFSLFTMNAASKRHIFKEAYPNLETLMMSYLKNWIDTGLIKDKKIIEQFNKNIKRVSK